jgi:hypothetical protein
MTAPDHIHDPLEIAPRSWRSWLAPGAMALITLIGIGAVFWGRFVDPTTIAVQSFDAGEVQSYEIGEVRPFEDVQIFMVGLEDGRLRAVDARVESSGCIAEFHPEDGRGAVDNPLGRDGSYVDPCTGASWFLDGDQLDAAGGASEPLRTFVITYETPPGDVQHAYVEVIDRE